MRPSIIVCLFALSFTLSAQDFQVPTLSPFTEIKQEVGLMDLSLSYSRPSAKGRTVFGELVPYDKVWRTGANAATKLTTPEAIKVGGNDLPAGTYALYTIPGREEWTIIIHKNTGHRSIAGGTYKQEEDAFRFQVRPIQNPLFVETFTLAFTDLATDHCHLTLSWANTIVKIPIEIDADAQVERQIQALLKTPDAVPHMTYFRMAEYYLHNGKDLAQAKNWIDTALTKDANNFRYGLLEAKILAAQNKKQEAMNAARRAHQWAMDAKNANYMEQTKVFMESLNN